MNKEVFWRTLFLILATVNLTVLVMSYSGYSGAFGSINTSLTEEFESALQDNNMVSYGLNYTRATEALSQLKDLHPPFWKTAKHQEYEALAQELRGMEMQVRQQQNVGVSSDTMKATYSRMPNFKPADVDRMMKNWEDSQQRQVTMRAQLLPKYKEKLDRFKTLGRSLS